MPDPKKCAATAAAGLTLALLLGACAGAEEEPTPPDAADTAGGAPDDPAEAGEQPEAELGDPMEMAPDDLCAVLSDATLDELLGAQDTRTDAAGTTGVPDPDAAGPGQPLRTSCLLSSAAGFSLQYEMEIHDGLYVDGDSPDHTEEDADPDVDLGDFAVVGPDNGTGGADVTAIEGQVLVHVRYTRMGSGDEDALFDGAVLTAEEVLAAVEQP